MNKSITPTCENVLTRGATFADDVTGRCSAVLSFLIQSVPAVGHLGYELDEANEGVGFILEGVVGALNDIQARRLRWANPASTGECEDSDLPSKEYSRLDLEDSDLPPKEDSRLDLDEVARHIGQIRAAALSCAPDMLSLEERTKVFDIINASEALEGDRASDGVVPMAAVIRLFDTVFEAEEVLAYWHMDINRPEILQGRELVRGLERLEADFISRLNRANRTTESAVEQGKTEK